MKLSEYYKMMAEIDGTCFDTTDPDVSVIDLNFNDGPGKQGSAMITCLYGEPVHLSWYIWSLDHEWMLSQVEEKIGHKIKLSNWSGGNGHCGADIEVL